MLSWWPKGLPTLKPSCSSGGRGVVRAASSILDRVFRCVFLQNLASAEIKPVQKEGHGPRDRIYLGKFFDTSDANFCGFSRRLSGACASPTQYVGPIPLSYLFLQIILYQVFVWKIPGGSIRNEGKLSKNTPSAICGGRDFALQCQSIEL